MSNTTDALRLAITAHPRVFEHNRYVYPVISRRSRGMSVGINLNPDKICNFDCIYCQVDRTTAPQYREVELPVLERELRTLLEDAQSGILYNHPRFKNVPNDLKRINDIAFSGDGEPTTYPQFGQAVCIAGEVKNDLGLRDVKLIAITNATRFHRPDVLDALVEMHKHNGEIWAKLDAGTADYYALVERTKIPFDTVIENLHTAARRWPILIQSLFMRIHGTGPAPEEISAYADILRDIHEKSGALKGVQIYTVARRPTETYVEPLANAELDAIADAVRSLLPGVNIDVYYGATPN